MGNGEYAPMINDSTPLEGEDWYYLNRSRQVGPYSTGELRLLLAKDVIAPTTLVWRQGIGGWRALRDVAGEPVVETQQKRRNWSVVALVVTIFFCGITIVAELPTGSELRNVVAAVPKSESRQEVTGTVRGDNRTNITEVAMTEFSGPQLVENPSREFPIGAGLINSVPVSLLAKAPATRAALSPEGQLNPGTSADIATEKIKELGRATKQASVNKSKAEAAKKKTSIDSSKTINWKNSTKATAVKASTPKTSALCGNTNTERCRERCRKGEARSCRKLKKLGG
jgi:uncharacterized protein DUF4339